jgi:HEAT repeat protein
MNAALELVGIGVKAGTPVKAILELLPREVIQKLQVLLEKEAPISHAASWALWILSGISHGEQRFWGPSLVERERISDVIAAPTADTRAVQGLCLALQVSHVEGRVEPLIARLHAEEAYLRVAAAGALTYSQDARAVDALVDALSDEEASVRMAAIEALQSIGDKRVVDALIDTLNDEEAYIRRRSLEALRSIGDARVIDTLVPMLDAEDVWVRKSVADALGAFGDSRAVDALSARVVTEESFPRAAMVEALASIGEEGISALESMISKTDSYIMYLATQALGRSGDSRAIEILISKLNDEALKDYTRATVAEALGNSGSTQAIEPLILALNDESSNVTEQAALALGKINDPRAIDALEAKLDSDIDMLQLVAAQALGRSGDSRAIEILISKLNDEALKDYTRATVAEALGNSGSTQAIEPLILALDDEEAFVRRKVAEALGLIGDERAIEPLVAALNDERVNDEEMEIYPNNSVLQSLSQIASSDEIDLALLSRDVDGYAPFLDIRKVIGETRVRTAIGQLGLPIWEVRRRYQKLAHVLPLKLSDELTGDDR